MDTFVQISQADDKPNPNPNPYPKETEFCTCLVLGGHFAKEDPWGHPPALTDTGSSDDDTLDEAYMLKKDAKPRRSKYSEADEAKLREIYSDVLKMSSESRKKVTLNVVRERRKGCELLVKFTDQQLRDTLFNMACQ